jgi:hypothetical protein
LARTGCSGRALGGYWHSSSQAGEKRSCTSTLRRVSASREPRPTDHTDAAKDVARELADVATALASLKGEASTYLRDPNLYTAIDFSVYRGGCPTG